MGDNKHTRAIKRHINLTNNNDFHETNISLLYIICILFGLAGLYFLITYKKQKEKENDEKKNSPNKKIEQSKYLKIKYILYISVCCLIRCVSLIYVILIQNKTGYDMYSYINYLCHYIPTILFVSVFILYLKTLIIDYVKIKTNKKGMKLDNVKGIIFVPSIEFLLLIIYFLIFVLVIVTLFTRKYITYYIISNSLLFLLSLIICSVYIIYGVKVLKLLYQDIKGEEGKISNDNSYIRGIKENRNRIWLVVIIVSIGYIFRGYISIYFCIYYYKIEINKNLNVNLMDFLMLFFCELLCSAVIWYQKLDENKEEHIQNDGKTLNVNTVHEGINYNNNIFKNVYNTDDD